MATRPDPGEIGAMWHNSPADRKREFIALRAELRAVTVLALPVVIVQVALMSMGVVDSIMVGHVSARVLASVALGNIYFFNVIVLSMGTLMALDPIVAQAVGAHDDVGVARGIQRGFLIALFLSVFSALVMAPAGALLALARQPAEIVPDAAAYVQLSIIGVFPFLGFVVLRQSMQAMGKLAPIVVTALGANVLNAGLNWVFVFGHLGSPALGASGSAIATVLSRWAMFGTLLALSWRLLRRYVRPLRSDSFRMRPLKRMLAIGIPIGVQQFLEVGAFGAIGLLMGWFGTAQVAAHQIAIQLAALTFMVPLGVAIAGGVRVGHAIGARDPERARLAARVAFVCGVAFMACTAILFLTLPERLAGLFSTDGTVTDLAALLIPVAGVFQIFDGIQAVAAGVLRGIGDTRAPLLAMVVGYWAIGLPTSIYLGFRTDAGPVGLWWGFVAGLGSVALFLTLRAASLLLGDLTRIRIDDDHVVVE